MLRTYPLIFFADFGRLVVHLGMDPSIGRADQQPNRWPSTLIRPAIAVGTSLDPIQSTWQPPRIAISSLSGTFSAHSFPIPKRQLAPFSLTPANESCAALDCTEGGPTPQTPSVYTQQPGQSSSEPRSSAASAAFAQQFGALGTHTLSKVGNSQIEYV